MLAEVVGFHERGVLLMPLGDIDGLHPGSSVTPLGRSFGADVGPGLARPSAEWTRPSRSTAKDRIDHTHRVPLPAEPPHPLQRAIITEPLETGVRAIDGFLTLGSGQRVGIFAGSGVGKSTLLGMIARDTAKADVNVIALARRAWPRGARFHRELARPRGPAALGVVVAPPPTSPRSCARRGALVATAIAEYFRDQGKDVLLMMDSVTRVRDGAARGRPRGRRAAGDEGLSAVGVRDAAEAARARRHRAPRHHHRRLHGARRRRRLQRADRRRQSASILDGHIVLSRKLAARGSLSVDRHLESKSRVRDHVITPTSGCRERRGAARGGYREKEDLILVGAYHEGSDRNVDAALRLRPQVLEFLQQPGGKLRVRRVETCARFARGTD